MTRPDIVIIMTDQERAAPPYESDELKQWRKDRRLFLHMTLYSQTFLKL